MFSATIAAGDFYQRRSMHDEMDKHSELSSVYMLEANKYQVKYFDHGIIIAFLKTTESGEHAHTSSNSSIDVSFKFICN